MAFAAPALPFISVGLGVAQYKQQGAAGKFNQNVMNRNAQISEQEAAQIQKQTEFDIARFDQDIQKVVGKTAVSTAKAGVAQDTGTALRLARRNAEEAELQKNIMVYNSKVGQAKKMEEANFYRIQGQVARQTARSAQIQTIAQTTTSLLRTA